MSNAPPGWYDDPVGEADERWFDGVEWAEPVRSRPPPPPPPPPPAPRPAPRTPAGWYPDPSTRGQERWGDGGSWSHQTKRAPPPPTVPQTSAAPQRSGLRVAVLVGAASVAGLFVIGLVGSATNDSADRTVTAADRTTTSVDRSPTSDPPSSVEPEPVATADAGDSLMGEIDGSRLDFLLDGLAAASVVERLVPEVPYDRDDYQRDGWADHDGDCATTRHEVLTEESLSPVTLSADGCQVEAGEWLDPYTGETYHDSSEVSIDHVVALAAAHRAGGWNWDLETKQAFANDLEEPATLAVAGLDVNNEKGDQEPDRWRPPQESSWCRYAADWITTKIRWGLSFSEAEVQSLEEMLDSCERLDSASYEVQPLAPTATSTTTSTELVTTTSTTAAPPDTTTTSTTGRRCDPNYSGCVPIASDVDCAGGSGNGPEYVQGPVQVIGTDIYDLDGNNDGVGCE